MIITSILCITVKLTSSYTYVHIHTHIAAATAAQKTYTHITHIYTWKHTTAYCM